jgi:hypothetical protein
MLNGLTRKTSSICDRDPPIEIFLTREWGIRQRSFISSPRRGFTAFEGGLSMSLPIWPRPRMFESFIAVALAATSLPTYAVEVHHFDVPAEDAARAIRDFGAQSHVQILVAGEHVKEKRLHAVAGDFSTDRALQIMLSDSGLAAQYVGDRAVALVPLSRAESAALTITDAGGTAPSPSAAPADGTEPAKLEEVVVTASKRQELLSKTPIAVSAITARSLDQQGITSTAGLTASVPNLQMSTQGQGSLVISIRGISSNNVTELGNPAVAFHIDGVYEPRPEGINQFLADIDRIEVLRGPQGTLYGRNATAGSINVLTATPEQKFAARADISYGNYDDLLTRGVLNIPVIGGLALRLALFREKNDGYTDTHNSVVRNYNLMDEYGGRLTALWSGLDNFKWKLSIDDFRNNGTPPLGIPYPHRGSIWDATVNTPGNIDDSVLAVRSRMDWNIATDWSLAYIAGYGRINNDLLTDSDGTATINRSAHYTRHEEHYSHELDLQYDSNNIKGLLGLFYFDEQPHTILLSSANATGTQTLQFYDLTIEQKSKAAFGQLTYALTDRLRPPPGCATAMTMRFGPCRTTTSVRPERRSLRPARRGASPSRTLPTRMSPGTIPATSSPWMPI